MGTSINQSGQAWRDQARVAASWWTTQVHPCLAWKGHALFPESIIWAVLTCQSRLSMVNLAHAGISEYGWSRFVHPNGYRLNDRILVQKETRTWVHVKMDAALQIEGSSSPLLSENSLNFGSLVPKF